MRDKRPVEDLSIEELEQVLAIRKRQEREHKLQRMKRAGRVVSAPATAAPAQVPAAAMPIPTPEAAAVLPAASLTLEASVRPAGTAPSFEDDFAAAEIFIEQPPNPERARFWKRFVNQSLLLVEVLAIAGLAFLGYQMFSSIGRLEEETSAAQALANEQRQAALPTLVPTPQLQLISDYILPGGHVFDSTGQALPNFEEIPVALRPVLANQLFAPVISAPPPITAETAMWIDIPKIGVSQGIVQGTDWESLKQGVGQLLNGVRPGDPLGNLVLSGHNDIYGEVFKRLDELSVGDEFTVRTASQVFTYRITGTDIVEPTDVHVLDPRGGPTATLISCYPYKVNTERYIVYAERLNVGSAVSG